MSKFQSRRSHLEVHAKVAMYRFRSPYVAAAAGLGLTSAVIVLTSAALGLLA